MTTTKTADINATLQQIAPSSRPVSTSVRVAVPHWEDAEALVAIAAKSTVPRSSPTSTSSGSTRWPR